MPIHWITQRGDPMQPSQLGRIILSGGSSSSDEMRVKPDESDRLDELLAEVSAGTVRPGSDLSVAAED